MNSKHLLASLALVTTCALAQDQEPAAVASGATISAEDRVNAVRAEKLRQAELDHRIDVVAKQRAKELAELDAENKKLAADLARAEAEIATAQAEKAKAELEAKSPGGVPGGAVAAAPEVMTREEARAMIESTLAARRAEAQPQMSPTVFGGVTPSDFGKPPLQLVGLVGDTRALFIGRNDVVIEADIGEDVDGYRFSRVVKDGVVVTQAGKETLLRIGARK